MALKILSSFKNNRNNGNGFAKAPSTAFEVGQFVVFNGLGGVMPYLASVTLLGAQTGTFVLGESVSQATSGATGVIVAITAAGITVDTVTGTFDTTHVVTGGTSSATMTPSSVLTDNKILGISNQQITSASSSYTDTSDLNVSTPVTLLDYIDIPVSIGTATTGMVGSYFNIDPLTSGSIDVTAAGTQILVTRVIDADNVVGVIALKVA